jgi:peptide/nickel transport system permease protein
MIKLTVPKLLQVIPVLILVSIATFLMIDLVPGDPALTIAGENATPEQVEAVRDELGLDRPIVERYVDWLGDTVQGDLGQSLVPPVQDVSSMVAARLPVTLQIASMAMIMSLLIAIPLALRSAHRPNDRFDRATNSVAFGLISIPSFLAALLLIFFFVFHTSVVRLAIALIGGLGVIAYALRTRQIAARYPSGKEKSRLIARRLAIALAGAAVVAVLVIAFPVFPRQGFVRLTSGEGLLENLRSAFLPALTLALTEAAIFLRLLRSDLIETLKEDYILSARAKGMPTWRILYFDALRPSSFSLITVAGVALGRAIGGTVIVETIFNLPGMGTLVVDSIRAHDFRIVQICVLIIAVFYVLINTVVDLSYLYLDPRIRRGRR